VKLADLVEQYIAIKQAAGMRFRTQSNYLRQFTRRLGPVDIEQVDPKAVLEFLYRSENVTRSWHETHSALHGFYRYAVSREYVKASPLPQILPKKPQCAQPYVYSTEEIRALLESSKVLNVEHRLGTFCVTAFRTLLLLLYGAGLRLSEALSLTLADTNLADSLLTVRNTKFYKSRFVPIGPKLTAVLRDHLHGRQELYGQPRIDSVLFLNSRGAPMTACIAHLYFKFIRKHAGVRRTDGSYFQPRLHDFRSSFAVHRLVTWYRQGADVQRLLPQLSTYLGHAQIADTQAYLRMTPELLREANRRFEQYALSEVNHAR
jgi:integrase/recombinase XerD